MPNWCTNIVEIDSAVSSDLDAVMAMLDGVENPFEIIFPMPPGEDWYDWCNANWGTKWDASSFQINRYGDNITMTFDTAWAPSLGVTAALADRFPSLNIQHFYEEPGMAFTGRATFEDGRMTADDCRDMTDEDMFFDEEGNEKDDYVPLLERF